MRTSVVGIAVALIIASGTMGLTGCEPLQMDCEDLSGMLDGPGGLTVTEEEHLAGWGRSTCFSCHSVERMHVMNCTGLEEVDLAEIRAIVDTEGEGACGTCHGDNGVLP